MFRLKTVSSLMVYGAATLVFLVFVLHLFTPSYHFSGEGDERLKGQGDIGARFLTFSTKRSELGSAIPAVNGSLNGSATSLVECRDKSFTIEQYRAQSVVRGVIVRFPSRRTEYYFVQFRWFYRSWIESEMFTLDRWRTDIIVLIDEDFTKETQQLLESLNCRLDNQRTSRRQTSRCVLVMHQLFPKRSESERQSYLKKYPRLGATAELDGNVDRVFAVYDYVSQVNKNQTLYDVLMVTTMNSFLTTQFGKYVPLKCAFVIGTDPDYSTWYAQTAQILEFADALLSTPSKDPPETSSNSTIDFSSTIEAVQKRFLFTEKQVDVPCDSTLTTYRTYIYHLKCYAHSTSLFSERLFRQNAYDGFDKEPFNIYIAREYATLMALQSKVMTIDALQALAVNVTRREVFT